MIARLKRWVQLRVLAHLEYPDPEATLTWIEQRQSPDAPIVSEFFPREGTDAPRKRS